MTDLYRTKSGIGCVWLMVIFVAAAGFVGWLTIAGVL
jgi:hypothetical protein